MRRLIAGLAVALTLTPLVACTSTTRPNANPSPVAQASKTSLTIGISFDQPGIGFAEGNSYSGFDVDTAIYVAKALGVPESGITWKQADPGDRERLITSGAVDLVFSSYSITEERRQTIDFAGPYFVAHQDLLVRRNDTEITGPETLDNKVLCSVSGTTSAQTIQQRYRGRISLKEYPRFSECVAALDDSQVDAVTTDDVILAGFAASAQYKGKLKVVGQGFSDEYYGVGLKKGDTTLHDQVNAALKQYIADGSWKASLDTTVGPSGYSIPSPPTVG